MMLKIAERVQYLRARHGLSQAELAKKLGVTRSAINSWESYDSVPSVEKISKMAKIFNVTSDYIIGLSHDVTVDISNLSTNEQDVVFRMVECLENKNKDDKNSSD